MLYRKHRAVFDALPLTERLNRIEELDTLGRTLTVQAGMPVGPLPILMMASSILQVALGAKPPDPMQARLMWMMPIAFGFMFFFFPAGLVLYWLTNNILSIAQQWYINRKFGLTLKS